MAGLRVLRDNEAEATAFWPLVHTFLASVGVDVLKVLLLDRGFINGPEIGRLKREHHIDTVIPMRSTMEVQEDVRGLMQLPTPWEEYQPRQREPLPDVTRPSHGRPVPPAVRKRERKRQKTWPVSVRLAKRRRPTRAKFGNAR